MRFLDIGAGSWIFLLDIALMLILLLDSFQGHLRRGFVRWTQYLPFVIGGAYIAGLVSMLFTDVREIFNWLCVLLFAGGLIGFGLHQYFGIARKPGGYSWFRHYLMYGPTALAPLALSCAAAIGYCGSLGGDPLGMVPLFGLALWILLLGSLLQALLLHFRGAFNNKAMYLPYTFPLATLILMPLIFLGFTPERSGFVFVALSVSFVGTALIGFIGAGMHLRGFDRQVGGLNLALFNYLSGPPAFAPLVFSVSGGLGLVLLYLA